MRQLLLAIFWDIPKKNDSRKMTAAELLSTLPGGDGHRIKCSLHFFDWLEEGKVVVESGYVFRT